MEWEGSEAVEELSNGHINPVLLINPVTTKVIATHEEPDESSDDGSEDEYVEESGRKKGKVCANITMFARYNSTMDASGEPTPRPAILKMCQTVAANRRSLRRLLDDQVH